MSMTTRLVLVGDDKSPRVYLEALKERLNERSMDAQRESRHLSTKSHRSILLAGRIQGLEAATGQIDQIIGGLDEAILPE